MSSIEVISPGALTTVQDLGRPGWAHIGVPRSGAADRESLRLANGLVGNDPGAAALETTLTGPRLRFQGPATVALTGAAVEARVGERPVRMDIAFDVGDGEILRLGNAKSGLRTYVAVAGGIDVPLVLGSAATDTLTGLGPLALARGDILRLGRALVVAGAAGTAASPAVARESARLADPVLRLVRGPRDDWFTAAAFTGLTGEPFTVNAASNRIGLRLDGPPLERGRSGELLSEGLVPGALQVPGGGQPILLLADHPTTGGYPVIAVVLEADLAIAAQLRPGQRLRFTL